MNPSGRLASALVVLIVAAGCGSSANVEQERTAFLDADREWSQTTTDSDKFVSHLASDAVVYAPGMPMVRGTEEISSMYGGLSGAPGFSLAWTAARADVSAAGDLGYTVGNYSMSMGGASEKGKYVTIWKKQADGAWKVAEDIFNSDTPPSPPPATHVMLAPGALTWGDPPPGLPAGAKVAVVAGDPSKAEPFVLRAQMPAGWRVPLHWHPTTENLTVLSGTVSIGMESADGPLQDLTAGGFVALPAEMRHVFVSKTASTIQVHGMGPFGITYVNPADDPRQQQGTN
jgi:ketosteroid isomerase-like protein/quercetin dioxygenase-like cupin family protein